MMSPPFLYGHVAKTEVFSHNNQEEGHVSVTQLDQHLEIREHGRRQLLEMAEVRTVTLGMRSCVRQVRSANVRRVDTGSCTPVRSSASRPVKAVKLAIWRSDTLLCARFRERSSDSCTIAFQIPSKCEGGGRYLHARSHQAPALTGHMRTITRLRNVTMDAVISRNGCRWQLLTNCDALPGSHRPML